MFCFAVLTTAIFRSQTLTTHTVALHTYINIFNNHTIYYDWTQWMILNIETKSICHYLNTTVKYHWYHSMMQTINTMHYADPTIYQSEMLIMLLLILRTMFMELSIINVTATVLSARHSSVNVLCVPVGLGSSQQCFLVGPWRGTPGLRQNCLGWWSPAQWWMMISSLETVACLQMDMVVVSRLSDNWHCVHLQWSTDIMPNECIQYDIWVTGNKRKKKTNKYTLCPKKCTKFNLL